MPSAFLTVSLPNPKDDIRSTWLLFTYFLYKAQISSILKFSASSIEYSFLFLL